MEALRADDPAWIGQYRLLGKLGSGGMGMVYLAESPGGRLMAVKLIRPELAQNETFRDRFAREVTAARLVGGVFTAPVVDASLTGPAPWLVTAYVDGPSLDAAVQQGGLMQSTSLLALAAGLAEGLRAIHAAGLVHRDLKPANVLLASDGPRIIDFGVSRALDGAGLTSTGLIVGTPGFMSPEQAEGRDVGPASDIFSLGSVLTFAATGDGPFGSGNTPALLYRVVNGTPRIDSLPAEVRPLVQACLAKEPSQRPTADEILALVSAKRPAAGWLSWANRPATHLTQSAGIGAQPASMAPQPAASPPQPALSPARLAPQAAPRRRRRLGWRLVAAVALVLVAGGGAYALASLGSTPNGQAQGSSSTPPDGQSPHVSGTTPAAGSSPNTVDAVRSPGRVVHAYFAAINRHDWPRVWHISHRVLRAMHESYRQMVAGYQNTTRDVVTAFVVRGDVVSARVRAHETGGPVQIYAFRFVVRHGIMIHGKQTLIRTLR